MRVGPSAGGTRTDGATWRNDPVEISCTIRKIINTQTPSKTTAVSYHKPRLCGRRSPHRQTKPSRRHKADTQCKSTATRWKARCRHRHRRRSPSDCMSRAADPGSGRGNGNAMRRCVLKPSQRSCRTCDREGRMWGPLRPVLSAPVRCLLPHGMGLLAGRLCFGCRGSLRRSRRVCRISLFHHCSVTVERSGSFTRCITTYALLRKKAPSVRRTSRGQE